MLGAGPFDFLIFMTLTDILIPEVTYSLKLDTIRVRMFQGCFTKQDLLILLLKKTIVTLTVLYTQERYPDRIMEE